MPAVIDQLFSVWGFIGFVTAIHLLVGDSASPTRKYLWYTNMAMIVAIMVASANNGGV